MRNIRLNKQRERKKKDIYDDRKRNKFDKMSQKKSDK